MKIVIDPLDAFYIYGGIILLILLLIAYPTILRGPRKKK